MQECLFRACLEGGSGQLFHHKNGVLMLLLLLQRKRDLSGAQGPATPAHP